MSNDMTHFDNLHCIAEFVPMSDERKEMLRQAASEIARLRLTDAEREAINMSRRILVSEPSMNPAQRAEWAITLSRLLDRTGFEQ